LEALCPDKPLGLSVGIICVHERGSGPPNLRQHNRRALRCKRSGSRKPDKGMANTLRLNRAVETPAHALALMARARSLSCRRPRGHYALAARAPVKAVLVRYAPVPRLVVALAQQAGTPPASLRTLGECRADALKPS
jgi:hypothetical protein